MEYNGCRPLAIYLVTVSKKRAVVELEMPAYLEEEMPAYHPNRNFWLVVMRESQRLGTYNVKELCKAQTYIQEWLTEAKAFILECQRLIDDANDDEQRFTVLLAREDVAILEDKLEIVTYFLRMHRAAEKALEKKKKEARAMRLQWAKRVRRQQAAEEYFQALIALHE